MKKILCLTACLAPLALSGCACGTPDCGYSETLDLIHDVIVEAVQKRVTRYETDPEARRYWDLFDLEAFRAIPDNYEVSHIRALSYDESTDVYECEARITYTYKTTTERTFRYRVETDQGDSQTLLSYERAMLGPAR